MKGIQEQVGSMNRLGNGLAGNHSENLQQNMASMRTGMQRLPGYYKR
jgi:hypothetical protein